MLNVLVPVYLDASKDVDTSEEINEGTPVTIDTTTGKLKKAKGNVVVYGLSMVDVANSRGRNFAYGEFGAYGSNKINAVKQGLVQLYPSVYELSDGSTVSVSFWVAAVNTLNPGTSLYIDNDGLITNNSSNSNSYLGKVSLNPSMNNGVLEIDLKC